VSNHLNEDSAMLKALKFFYTAWTDPVLRPTALKVALIVGSLLFTINHGSAVIRGEMTRERWLMGLITYLVPYTVSMHGQYSTQYRSGKSSMEHKEEVL
jgi:hypothetical protein